ncbi:MAG: PepSY domain-containing protein [Paramuribaculum sp.]|nr:PepSY domain-containing protein [Paramuribaculum sp.]
MNKINRTILSTHRISGTVIAVFFFMWFFTGLVLIYHGFPRLDGRKALELAGALPTENPVPDSLPEGLKSLRIGRMHGQTVVEWSTKDTSVVVTADGEPLLKPDYAMAEAAAKEWASGGIRKVDTLVERDQWIMYSRYVRELPIYKFYFDDKEGSEVYVGAASGEVLQTTDKRSRMWAWIGAIPHKLYFPAMREDVDVWKRWLLAGGLLCLVASLSGVYVALLLWIKRRRKTGRLENPMKGKVMRLHFALGLVFGLPLIAWSVSGVFSMQKVPRWMVGFEGEEYISASKLWGRGMLPLEEYKTDYEALKKAWPEMRELSYGRIGRIPVINVVTPDTSVVIDGRHSVPTGVWIEGAEAVVAVRGLYDDEDTKVELRVMDEYDSHYFSLSGHAPLPVYKIEVDNSDGTLFYINPRSGGVTYLNNNKIARRILFSGIHYLNLKPFAGHEGIWKFCMWIVCVTGMVFCLTSVWLGVKYVARKMRLICKGFHRR